MPDTSIYIHTGGRAWQRGKDLQSGRIRVRATLAGLVEKNFRSNIVFGECFTGEGDVFSGSLPEVLVVRGGLVRFVGLATCLAWREQGSAF